MGGRVLEKDRLDWLKTICRLINNKYKVSQGLETIY